MDKKEIIMKNALELFAKEGYEGCGIMKIVTVSEVTKPTLYHYFGSKEGVLRGIYEQYFTEFLKRLEAVAKYKENLMDCISDVIRVYIGFAADQPDFYWLSAHLRRGPKESESFRIVKTYHQEERELLETLMTHISSVHTNLKGMEGQLVRNLQNLVSGMIEDHIASDESFGINDGDVTLLTKQFLYGIFSL